ncbi:MAG: LON peptidase substrate-binding domain-containing protein [Rickettsiales bacterium]|nr:LON peptidase substrate-binding domain-containing protein [Rickettsiales bacterium]
MINNKDMITRKDLPKDLICLNVKDTYVLPFLDVAIQVDDNYLLNSLVKSFAHSDRLIGLLMYQNGKVCSNIGCLGKIRTFIEDEDNKIVIGVRGICRFNFEDIYLDKDNIRNIVPIWDRYLDDLDVSKIKINDRFKFQNILDSYCNNFHYDKIDYKKYTKISDQELFNYALDILDLDNKVKLNLLESHNFSLMLKIVIEEMELRLAEIEASAESKH